jgi:hypothetical protein
MGFECRQGSAQKLVGDHYRAAETAAVVVKADQTMEFRGRLSTPMLRALEGEVVGLPHCIGRTAVTVAVSGTPCCHARSRRVCQLVV